MTVTECLKELGITPGSKDAMEIMTDDYILAFKTAASQNAPGDYIVCQDCVTEHSGSINSTTQDKQYIRKGNVTIKTGAQRTFNITGDRKHGDAWQDWVFGLDMLFGTGSKVITEYVWFNLYTGEGETGRASVIVTSDAANGAGNNAGFTVNVNGVEKPKTYTYSAG